MTDNGTSIDAIAVSDGAYTLFVADFNDETAAWDAYEFLKQLEDGRHLEIEGVIVVKREDDGKIHIQKASDHSTLRGMGWGIAGGIVLGIIFPPSIIGSAIVVGAGGAGVGKLRELHHKSELADQLQDLITPGHSGLVALVSDPAVVHIRKALEQANRVVESAVDKALADDVKAAAKEAENAAKDADASADKS